MPKRANLYCEQLADWKNLNEGVSDDGVAMGFLTDGPLADYLDLDVAQYRVIGIGLRNPVIQRMKINGRKTTKLIIFFFIPLLVTLYWMLVLDLV